MTINRAIQLVEMERNYLLKKNEPESKNIREEIATALKMAQWALEAVQRIEQVFNYKGGTGK